MEVIFEEFKAQRHEADIKDLETWEVEYHYGTPYSRYPKNDKELNLELLANPSHLETVDPIVMGRVRGEQHFMKDDELKRKRVVPILIHGDAAFSG